MVQAPFCRGPRTEDTLNEDESMSSLFAALVLLLPKVLHLREALVAHPGGAKELHAF